ncbi:MAG: hypothetical protein U0Z53_18955 [Blastocatellia bacterium]
MIHNDAELQAMQERIRLFENILVEARKTYSPVNYQAMSEGCLAEIERMQAEIRAYLSCTAEEVEAA